MKKMKFFENYFEMLSNKTSSINYESLIEVAKRINSVNLSKGKILFK